MMHRLQRALQDRDLNSLRTTTLAWGAVFFAALQVWAQPLLLRTHDLLRFAITAISLAGIVAVFERVVARIRANAVLGKWVYLSSSGNYGLAEISMYGVDLHYEVQLYRSEVGVRAALTGDPIPDGEVLGHAESTYVNFSERQVHLHYEVTTASSGYAQRAGFLILRGLGLRDFNEMVGYWTSASEDTGDSRSGELKFRRAKAFLALNEQQQRAVASEDVEAAKRSDESKPVSRLSDEQRTTQP